MQKSKQFVQFPNKASRNAEHPVVTQTETGAAFNVTSLTLVGIGGIIGAGFFLASGMPIAQAGPGIVISYIIGALLMAQVLGSITSISINHKVRGSFRVYAEELLGSYIGFLQGWVFFVSGVLALTSEAVAMSIFTKLWLPHIPLSILATVYVALIVALNAFGVRNFGKIESFMSIVKIAAIVGFIVVGGLVITGMFQSGHPISYRFFTQGQGFLPKGLGGVGKSMLIVIFSYSGIGVIANAVSEVDSPKHTIPRATSGLIISITLLYVLATVCLLFMIPWTHIGTAQSPYVAALNAIHMPLLATILNAIILISAFSVMAGTLYSNLIMLKSLAQSNKAPKFLLKEHAGGKPWGALLFCSGALLITLLLAYLLPSKVYNYLTSASAFFTFFNWTIMVLTFLKWLKKGYKKGDTISRWVWAKPYGQWVTLVVIAALALYSVVEPDQRVGFYYALGVFAVISAGYWWVARQAK